MDSIAAYPWFVKHRKAMPFTGNAFTPRITTSCITSREAGRVQDDRRKKSSMDISEWKGVWQKIAITTEFFTTSQPFLHPPLLSPTYSKQYTSLVNVLDKMTLRSGHAYLSQLRWHNGCLCVFLHPWLLIEHRSRSLMKLKHKGVLR